MNLINQEKWGNVAIKPLNKIKRIAGKRLQKAWQVIPQVTHYDKADITKLEQLRLSLKKINPDKNIKPRRRKVSHTCPTKFPLFTRDPLLCVELYAWAHM